MPNFFTEGNQFWNLRSKHGRDKIFETPEDLMQAAMEYFRWCDENPMMEDQIFATKAGIVHEQLPKKRPYTLQGLCRYLNCSIAYLRNFKNQERIDKEKFLPTIKQIEDIVYEQKFSGAAAGFFNSNIITRDLGLKEHTDFTSDNEKITQPVITHVIAGNITPLKMTEKSPPQQNDFKDE